MSPLYEAYLHKLTMLCKRHDYALFCHGSCLGDLDLVAVPFGEQPIEAERLFKKVVTQTKPVTVKKHIMRHHRITYMMVIDEWHIIDFSIVDCKDA